MKKIYTKTVYQYDKKSDSYALVEADYYLHDGAIACAKGGGESSGGGGGTTVQKTEPWDSQKPHLDWIYNIARDNFTDKNPAQYYPDSTVVPFSPETETALQFQSQRALNGSPVQTAANQQLTDTLNGNYLYGGEGFNAAVDAATRKIMPQIDSAFERAGRTGSGLAQQAKTQAISDSFASQYGQERENQLRSMLFAPQMLQQDYVDAAKLAEVGAQREGLQAENIQDSINRYYGNDPYARDLAKLQDYLTFVNGNAGATTTTTGASSSSGSRSPLGGILGGAMTGFSATGSPWGAAAGGLLGGFM